MTYVQYKAAELRTLEAQSRHVAPERRTEINRVEQIQCGDMKTKTIDDDRFDGRIDHPAEFMYGILYRGMEVASEVQDAQTRKVGKRSFVNLKHGDFKSSNKD